MIIEKLPLNIFDIDDLAEVNKHFDNRGTPGELTHAPWKAFPFKPDVQFRIASMGNKLIIKFYVIEQEIKFNHKNNNENVFEDSCVEFFISTGRSDGYYNFEFNCIGTTLVQYGKNREDRIYIDSLLIDKIKRVSSIEEEGVKYINGLIHWELLVVIPSELFAFDTINFFSGLSMSGNFYKCGDLLQNPHYLSWNNIATENPDFHRPEYFSPMIFL